MSADQAPNAFYAQSGGVTAVINASALGVIQAAAAYPDKIGKSTQGKRYSRCTSRRVDRCLTRISRGYSRSHDDAVGRLWLLPLQAQRHR